MKHPNIRQVHDLLGGILSNVAGSDSDPEEMELLRVGVDDDGHPVLWLDNPDEYFPVRFSFTETGEVIESET